MTKLKLPCILISAAMLSGCATIGIGAKYVPLLDMRGRDQAQADEDVRDCQRYAAGEERGAVYAAIGAVTFGLMGAVLAPRGMRNEVAARAAGIGAATGAVDGIGTQQDIIRRCMAGRGWVVLQ